MSLFRNVLTVGGVTLASRVLGFLRDTLIAAVLGTGPVADAFFVAFRLPNLFRRLFAEGAFAAAFVPLFVRLRGEAGEPAAGRFAGEALAGLTAVVVAVSIPAMIFAPALIDLLAPGFAVDVGKRALAIDLARLCFPYLACVSVVALLSGRLAADRRFLVPALAPVVLNLVLIGALVALLVAGGVEPARAGRGLAIAVTVAGLAQVGLLVAAAMRLGAMPPRLSPRLTPEIRRLWRLGLPGLLAGGMSEIGLIVGTMIASTTAGAVSWLYYADRLYQLPLGVVGIAVGQVLLPEIALALRDGDGAESHAVQNRALEFALALALPAALALILLADPIVSILFERGAFLSTDRAASARALAIFAVGLPAFVLVRVLAPAFFAREDTATPMVVGGVAVAVNLALALALWPVVGWLSVAIATAAAGWVNAGLLLALLLRRRHWRLGGIVLGRLARLAAAAVVMAAVVHLAHGALADLLAAGRPLVWRAGALAGLVATGLLVYAALVVAFRVVDLARLRALAAGRRDGLVVEASCPRPEDRA